MNRLSISQAFKKADGYSRNQKIFAPCHENDCETKGFEILRIQEKMLL